jgi:hypothetical protein
MSRELKILELLLSGLGLAFALWLFYRALQRSESPLKVVVKALLTVVLLAGEFFLVRQLNGAFHESSIVSNATPALFMMASVAILGVILSIVWTPQIGGLLASPLTDIFDGGHQPPERRPAYSAAGSKRKQGRPLEAVVIIREQLAQFPNDFQGILLLATIQAEDLDDLPGAEITLKRFCDSPGAPDEQVIKALTQLADWHFSRDADAEAVREIMQRLLTQFPDAKVSRRLAARLERVHAEAGQTDAMPSAKAILTARLKQK